MEKWRRNDHRYRPPIHIQDHRIPNGIVGVKDQRKYTTTVVIIIPFHYRCIYTILAPEQKGRLSIDSFTPFFLSLFLPIFYSFADELAAEIALSSQDKWRRPELAPFAPEKDSISKYRYKLIQLEQQEDDQNQRRFAVGRRKHENNKNTTMNGTDRSCYPSPFLPMDHCMLIYVYIPSFLFSGLSLLSLLYYSFSMDRYRYV